MTIPANASPVAATLGVTGETDMIHARRALG